MTVQAIAPAITGDPQPQTVTVGQTAAFGVVVTGTKPFTYQWERGTVDSLGDTSYLSINGAADSSYITPAASLADNGRLYRCTVGNSAGSDVSAAALLTVQSGVIAPIITGEPQPQIVNVGQTATFGVVASGTKPFTYQWQKDSVDISAATDSGYTTPATVIGDSGSTYRCIVSNGAGADSSAAALLTVTTVIIKPTITGDPQSTAVNEGQTATFGVIASGTKPFTYQWQKELVNISGATDSSYTTPATTMGDNGTKYRCVVTNSGDSATSAEAVLTVNAIPPAITGDPQPQSVNVGQTATFGVIASGTKPFTYQWQKNSVNIGGATDSSYTTPATIMGDSGSTFRCIVSNGGGNATSGEAILHVSSVTMTDIDGNVYNTITIGTQTWIVGNFRSSRLNDGTSIPAVPDSATWVNLTTPGYCWYDNDSASNADTYGALYNWHTVNTNKLAPAGWHVPDNADWYILHTYLTANGYNWDGTTTGNKMAKSMAAKTDWESSDTAGYVGNDMQSNNSSGFSALPGGCRSYNGYFYNHGYYGYWWSATEDSGVYYCLLSYNKESIWIMATPKQIGISVRLVRD